MLLTTACPAARRRTLPRRAMRTSPSISSQHGFPGARAPAAGCRNVRKPRSTTAHTTAQLPAHSGRRANHLPTALSLPGLAVDGRAMVGHQILWVVAIIGLGRANSQQTPIGEPLFRPDPPNTALRARPLDTPPPRHSCQPQSFQRQHLGHGPLPQHGLVRREAVGMLAESAGRRTTPKTPTAGLPTRRPAASRSVPDDPGPGESPSPTSPATGSRPDRVPPISPAIADSSPCSTAACKCSSTCRRAIAAAHVTPPSLRFPTLGQKVLLPEVEDSRVALVGCQVIGDFIELFEDRGPTFGQFDSRPPRRVRKAFALRFHHGAPCPPRWRPRPWRWSAPAPTAPRRPHGVGPPLPAGEGCSDTPCGSLSAASTMLCSPINVIFSELCEAWRFCCSVRCTRWQIRSNSLHAGDAPRPPAHVAVRPARTRRRAPRSRLRQAYGRFPRWFPAEASEMPAMPVAGTRARRPGESAA